MTFRSISGSMVDGDQNWLPYDGETPPSTYLDNLPFANTIVTGSAPAAKKQVGSIDVMGSLLLTTLAVVATALPIGKRLSDSAPRTKYQTTTIMPARPIAPGNAVIGDVWSDSAPSIKSRLCVDVYPNNLGRLLPGPIPVGDQLIDLVSVDRKKSVSFDTVPNLLTTTLTTSAALPIGDQWSDSAPRAKYEVTFLLPSRGFAPAPASVPFILNGPLELVKTRYNVEWDTPPNLLLTTLRVVSTSPPFNQTDWTSAPSIKSYSTADLYVTAIAPSVPFLSVDTLEVQSPKKDVRAEVFPTLIPPAAVAVAPFFPVLNPTTPSIKHRSLVVDPPRSLVLGLPVSLPFFPVDTTMDPPRKSAVYSLNFPLLTAPVANPLPIGLVRDLSEFQGKKNVYDWSTNTRNSQLPVPIPPPTPLIPNYADMVVLKARPFQVWHASYTLEYVYLKGRPFLVTFV